MSTPTTYDEVFRAIFEYIDRIFRIVRPRKLLFMAIDGVAPRAKMNQQRARRFRAAKDAEIADKEEDRLRREFEKAGRRVLPKQKHEVFDSNVITPGTVFMQKLSKALEYYIRLRLNGDPGWKNIKVILSNANVPGEGEHKIMSFVRQQRVLPGYDPNTRHCLYGADADLFMLSLATHEVNFSIIREEILKVSPDYSSTSLATNLSQGKHEPAKSRSWYRKVVEDRGGRPPKKPYQFLNVWTLREYLELDLMITDPPFEIDFERVVDDFVFISFLLGNDFLPHLPSLEIHEGAVDLLMTVYKQKFKKIGGYLVDTSRMKDKKAAYVKVKHLQNFIQAVGTYENKIFEKRYDQQQRRIRRLLHEKSESMAREDSECLVMESSVSDECEESSVSDERELLRNTKELMQQVKFFVQDKQDLFKNGDIPNDKIKWGLPNWRERYYREKFSVESPEDIEKIRKETVLKYTEGLCWVLQYYFAGVSSWKWYYPYYYGPFASDFKGVSCCNIKFDLGHPFKPLDQLMAVLPVRSLHAVPQTYSHLMYHKDSRLLEFYPDLDDIEVDTSGKRYLWQGIVRLPFINEDLLISETRKLETKLTDDEIHMNPTSLDKLFVRADGPAFQFDEIVKKLGFSSPVERMERIADDHVVFADYENPTPCDHVPKLLENVRMPERTITVSDLPDTQLWHEKTGNQRRVNSSSWEATQQKDRGKGLESSSPASLPREEWKGAGSGWSGRGRGRSHFEGSSSSGLVRDSSASLAVVGWRGAGIGRGGRGRGRSHSEESSSRSFQEPTNTKTGSRGEGSVSVYLTNPGLGFRDFTELEAKNVGSLQQPKGFNGGRGGRGYGRSGSGTYGSNRAVNAGFSPSANRPATRGRGNELNHSRFTCHGAEGERRW